MIGNVVEKYEVIQKIGEGGMATVYRGRHTTLGREVAIKVLHPHLSASERNRMRFAREARAIEHLEHDNILKIFDYSGCIHRHRVGRQIMLRFGRLGRREDIRGI